MAFARFPGSKRHSERRNQPSLQQLRQIRGWRCLICERDETLGVEDDRWGVPVVRVVDVFDHPDDRGAWLGSVCYVQDLTSSHRVYGCLPTLGRVARGTRYGSVRWLERLKYYRDNPVPYSLIPGIKPMIEDRRVATRLQGCGVDITAAEIASFRSVAGSECQVCHLSAAKRYPRQKAPVGLDHDDREKRARGWLCQACNGAMQFMDLPEPEQRDRYYANALWLFRDAVGVRGDAWYRTMPWYQALEDRPA
ncbi:endonuclease domain-containing protein [Nonomuraea zeae]|uniref:endonuclease domain-containing protein n=1 Tax=Nonomuraea zeae TaxID=1642303 RepID=UPI0014793650|nr:endonuclease domain-containing protein [Nonomuraea zeae]